MGARHFIAIAAVACIASRSCAAETRRAVLVGVNTYERPAPAGGPATAGERLRDRGWTNLEGSLNDIDAMQAMLVGRYGFAPRNVAVLRDTAATRSAILSLLRTHLVKTAQKGDVCVFYYAGHGSQVYNSKSAEPDRFDETIVPADANQAATSNRDIRDKEIAALFNDILDRGATLTAFFDCCHSGSIARGIGGPGRLRSLRPDLNDIALADSDRRPKPADRGALVISAAQETQKAAEIVDPEGRCHGVFSFMLEKTLRSASTAESTERIFARVRALVASSEAGQSPDVEGSAERLAAPLFGGKATAGDKIVFGIQAVDGNRCRVQGGYALGLLPGCELVPVRDSSRAVPATRIRIDATEDLNYARASCIGGDLSTVRPGALFEVERWATGPGARLRVWIPPVLEEAALKRAAAEFAALPRSSNSRLIADPTETTPTHVVAWTGTDWMLSGPDGKAVKIAASTAQLAAAVKSGTKPEQPASVFVHLPPCPSVVSRLRTSAEAGQSPVQIVGKESEAQYLLVGRWANGQIEYAWTARNATQLDLASTSSMPVRTNWCAVRSTSTPDQVDLLQDSALRLAKVNGWMQLDPPPESQRFPYHLVLRNVQSNQKVANGNTVHDGDTIQLSLEASPSDLEFGVARRYVYVFVIDSFGRSTLIVGANNTGNFLPAVTLASDKIPPEIALHSDAGSDLHVSEPFGVDTYVLLTTKEPISDPSRVLAFDGVRAVPVTRGSSEESALSQLLSGLNAPTRGASLPTPVTWSLDRIALRSMK